LIERIRRLTERHEGDEDGIELVEEPEKEQRISKERGEAGKRRKTHLRSSLSSMSKASYAKAAHCFVFSALRYSGGMSTSWTLLLASFLLPIGRKREGKGWKG
jgi:predicted ATP-dependent protease